MTDKLLLLIDDEDSVREVAQMCLEVMGGYRVLTASSGAEGLKLAAEAHPDGILLDVMMPEMDGPSTFQALQADAATADIPVIFLTAKVQMADAGRLEAVGARHLLAKPFDPTALSG